MSFFTRRLLITGIRLNSVSIHKKLAKTVISYRRNVPILTHIRLQSSNPNISQNAKPDPKNLTAEDLFTSRLESLKFDIEKEYLNKDRIDNSKNNSLILTLYESIENFQSTIYDYDKLSPETNKYIVESNKLLQKILENSNTNFTEHLLDKLLLTQPPFPTLQTIIKSYYTKDKEAFIPSNIALIPFRKLIWDGQFHQALDFIDLTTGNKRYIANRKSKLFHILGYFGGSLAGLILGIHIMITVCFPELIAAGTGGTAYGIYGIYACILTYFINCGFLAALAFSSKGLENGNLMFQHYTLPQDWYMKVDQMKMCSKVLEADAEIHGMDGFATRDIVKRIQSMGFEVNEPEQEVMLRQYWYSSGEGFVWVEPDLDPAEIQWWDHLDKVGVKKVWDQNLSKLEEADATSEVEDGDIDAELYLPENNK